jgi:RND family efflux transporter MFP subunit
MTRILSRLGRYVLTLCIVVPAAVIALQYWERYQQVPWTRDGRVSADVVRLAPEVSGTVATVEVGDNGHVHRGDVLYVIDPERYRLAVRSAEADVEARRQEMIVRRAAAERRRRLREAISREDLQQVEAAAAVADADWRAAQARLDLARLDLARTTVRSPVDGYVSSLRLRPGDYAIAGESRISIVDAGSFRITGYFEETKIRHVRPGRPAQIRLMGFDRPLSGHVDSIGRGIENDNDTPGAQGLPDVPETFAWVRLARRIPVRIRIDAVPPGVELVAGMTAAVEITPDGEAPMRLRIF